jgi:hypothetical protein
MPRPKYCCYDADDLAVIAQLDSSRVCRAVELVGDAPMKFNL